MPLPKFTELGRKERELHKLCKTINRQRSRLVECLENHHLEIPYASSWRGATSWWEEAEAIIEVLKTQLEMYQEKKGS